MHDIWSLTFGGKMLVGGMVYALSAHLDSAIQKWLMHTHQETGATTDAKLLLWYQYCGNRRNVKSRCVRVFHECIWVKCTSACAICMYNGCKLHRREYGWDMLLSCVHYNRSKLHEIEKEWDMLISCVCSACWKQQRCHVRISWHLLLLDWWQI